MRCAFESSARSLRGAAADAAPLAPSAFMAVCFDEADGVGLQRLTKLLDRSGVCPFVVEIDDGGALQKRIGALPVLRGPG